MLLAVFFTYASALQTSMGDETLLALFFYHVWSSSSISRLKSRVSPDISRDHTGCSFVLNAQFAQDIDANRKDRQCLLDESLQIALDLACPSCQRSIVTTAPGPSATNHALPPASPQPLILVRYHNEGGIQENLDILPLITEEAYLNANPAARPARAFMSRFFLATLDFHHPA